MSLSLSSADVSLLASITGALQDARSNEWTSVMADLGKDLLRLFRADFLGTTRLVRAGHIDHAICVGRDGTMGRDYVREFQFCDPLSPLIRNRRGPVLTSSVMDPADLRRTRYFNEFLVPNGTVEGVDIHVRAGGTEIGDLRVWRGPGAEPLGQREVDLLRLLEPTLSSLFRRLAGPDGDDLPEGFSTLTARERQVALLIAKGLSDAVTARTLGVSVWTVRSHLTQVFTKLGLPNRTALAAAVRTSGGPRSAP
jgi:DNA-binding CsgD family transcriptional regulator